MRRKKRSVCRSKRRGRKSIARVRAAKLGWRRKKARGGRKLSCRRKGRR